MNKKEDQLLLNLFRAEDGTRTRDPNLGKVMLYQLSYFRVFFSNAMQRYKVYL